MKYYVVSDVHGFYMEMIKALSDKGFFDDKEPHKLVICGDLMDRGSESLKMQEFVLDLMDKDQVILIKGNHEDLVLEMLDNLKEYLKMGITNSHHYHNGTVQTCENLTKMKLTEIISNPDELIKRMNETPFIKKIIPSMLDYFETQKYIFVHGWIPCYKKPGVYFPMYSVEKGWRTTGKKEWEEARWTNGMLAAYQGAIIEGKTIVCGHFHCSYGHSYINNRGSEFGERADFSPYENTGIIAIDSCTAYSGFVNCVVLEDDPL